METPTHEVEYEQMLLSRHTFLNQRGGRRKNSLMERSAYILLSRIRVQGPMSIGELSDAFGLDTSTLNRQTAAAMRAGLIERIPDPEAGWPASSGSPGRHAPAGRGARGIVDILDQVMQDWSDDDIAAFAAT